MEFVSGFYGYFMPCYSPLDAYRSHHVNASGKRSLVFNAKAGARDRHVEIPCGQCIGCRLEYSRQWAMRCMHEAAMHEFNCFVTLTYADEYLPDYLSLDYRHLQLFFKRLRKRFGAGIRFYAAGEYGDQNQRPHYHAIIFNIDFSVPFDAYYYPYDCHGNTVDLVSESAGHKLYQSSALDLLWSDPITKVKYGFASVGTATFESAAYVARYVTKKVTGEKALDHYAVRDVNGDYLVIDDEIVQRAPERALMSRRPGVGASWFDKFKYDTYKDDTVIVRGKAVKPPKYYDNKFAADHDFESVKRSRAIGLHDNKDNCTRLRLRVREQVKSAQIASLRRTI